MNMVQLQALLPDFHGPFDDGDPRQAVNDLSDPEQVLFMSILG